MIFIKSLWFKLLWTSGPSSSHYLRSCRSLTRHSHGQRAKDGALKAPESKRCWGHLCGWTLEWGASYDLASGRRRPETLQHPSGHSRVGRGSDSPAPKAIFLKAQSSPRFWRKGFTFIENKDSFFIRLHNTQLSYMLFLRAGYRVTQVRVSTEQQSRKGQCVQAHERKGPGQTAVARERGSYFRQREFRELTMYCNPIHIARSLPPITNTSAEAAIILHSINSYVCTCRCYCIKKAHLFLYTCLCQRPKFGFQVI